eukprot:2787023-Amphidinium_carterae.1
MPYNWPHERQMLVERTNIDQPRLSGHYQRQQVPQQPASSSAAPYCYKQQHQDWMKGNCTTG